MRSIIQDKKECYLCRYLDGKEETVCLEDHHLFGAYNRKWSEKYGLKVWLCIEHHREGKEAVHRNKLVMDHMHQVGQIAFEKNHTREEFLNVFGRNYLDL